MKKIIDRALIAPLALAVLLLGTTARAAAPAGAFTTPEEAVRALAEIIATPDEARSEAMFGKDWRELLGSGDAVADREDARKVREHILEKVAFEELEGNRKAIVLGNAAWPFAVPLVKAGEFWRFDVAAGKDELLNRRIGQNELRTLATLHAYVDAQREYREAGRDGNPPAYAQKLWSDAGRHNGLHWPSAPGEPESPMGDLVAQAAEEGYRSEGATVREPYHGYLYRILTAQGKSAPGGEKSYLDEKGLMTRGFGAIAWPASYGKAGVMTFIVNQQGIVFQKDLGEQTETAAAAIAAYDPDETWNPTGD